MSHQQTARPVELRLRVDPVLLAGALLIGLQTVVRAVIVLPSYYWQDDFHHLEMARRLGLSQEFLVRDYSGHLEIGQYFLYWLIGRNTGLSFLPAALSLLVMQLIASVLLLAVLRTLFGSSPWMLLPFAGYLFTPLGLPVATWWAAGLQAMPLQIAMLLALLGLVRAVRLRSWRWAAVSVLGNAIGLVCWEKAVLVLPTLVAVLLLVEWAGRPGRLRLLARHWRYLLPHVVLLAGYLAVYLSVVESTAFLGAESRDVVDTSSETVFRLLVPGLFGGPWTATGAENTVYPNTGTALTVFFALCLLAVVVTSTWLRGRRALQGWLLVAGYVAVDVALLQIGRADFIGLLTRDPRYVTDALPVIAIGVCAAFTGPAVPRRFPRWTVQPVSPLSTALAGVAFLVASCLLTSSLLAGGLQHDYSRSYVQGAVDALQQDPGAAVVVAPLPTNVSISTDLPGLLRAVGEEHALDQPGTDAQMFDGLAVLRPVTVVGPTVQATGPTADCGWIVESSWQRLGRLPDQGPAPYVLQLGFVTGQAATLHVSVDGAEQAVSVPPGVGHATFVVTGQAGTVTAKVTDVAAGGVCVSDLVAGTPWPAD